MWIAIGVGAPVLLPSLAVAMWPVLSHSRRYHRWDHERSARHGRAFPQSHARADCALCAAQFEAPSAAEAVAFKNEHVLESHAQSGPEARPVTARTRVTRSA